MDATRPPAVELFLARITETDRDQWLADAGDWLAEGERTRADAIADPHSRALHMAGRALTRLIASARKGGDPRDFRITHTDEGKPVLADHPELWVNVAHSGNVVAVVVSEDARAGVDVEDLALTRNAPSELAARRFAPAEAEYLGSLAPELLPREFVRFWTIKEAVAKALGESIFMALSGVVLVPDGDALRLESVWMGPAPPNWTIHELDVPGGAERLAIAVAAPGAVLSGVRQVSLEAIAGHSPRQYFGITK